LIDQSLVSALPEPDKLDLTYIQRYLATPEMGPLALSGRDYSVWGSTRYPDCRCPDLVALKPRQNQDQFSKWFTTIFVKLMGYGARWIGNRSPTTGLRGIDDYRLLRATFWVTSVIASLLPVASISILYCVHSTPARMGLIAMFNLSVSVLLLKFTTAKRSEIFAVAAACVLPNSYLAMEHLIFRLQQVLRHPSCVRWYWRCRWRKWRKGRSCWPGV
jgi:hypothetical protein